MRVDSVTTPFGRRSLTYDQLKLQANVAESRVTLCVDKWKVFRHVSQARAHLGLQDRALAVLNALLSFLPGTELNPKQKLVVFPSNEQLSLRAHGVCPRTLRRSIATLVEAGVICRNDSPNGKRYAHRSKSGEIECAYGFDLRPLVTRAEEFANLAERILEEARLFKRSKEAVTICRRDMRKLLQLHCEHLKPEAIDAISVQLDNILALLPRQPSRAQLESTLAHLQALRTELLNHLKVFEKSPILSVNDGQDVPHKEESESESHIEKEQTATKKVEHGQDRFEPTSTNRQNEIPLDIVVRACPDIASCSSTGLIESWPTLIRASETARMLLGIDKTHYASSLRQIGSKQTAVLISCLFQRQNHIRSAGAYFCELSKLARANRFAPDKLVLSMLKQTYETNKSGRENASDTITISEKLSRSLRRHSDCSLDAVEKQVVRISRTN